jgi:hypothetical protein
MLYCRWPPSDADPLILMPFLLPMPSLMLMPMPFLMPHADAIPDCAAQADDNKTKRRCPLLVNCSAKP